MRETSSRSSTICVCARALRSMVSQRRARPGRRAASPRAQQRDQPRMALSGVRSSCESIARNSSLTRLARFGLAAQPPLGREHALELGFERAFLGTRSCASPTSRSIAGGEPLDVVLCESSRRPRLHRLDRDLPSPTEPDTTITGMSSPLSRSTASASAASNDGRL